MRKRLRSEAAGNPAPTLKEKAVAMTTALSTFHQTLVGIWPDCGSPGRHGLRVEVTLGALLGACKPKDLEDRYEELYLDRTKLE